MAELRAALAIAQKDLRWLSRYPLFLGAWVILPLYQLLLPSFLFGATFRRWTGDGPRAERGNRRPRRVPLPRRDHRRLVAQTFWGVAWGLRSEMDAGTLEAMWLAPTGRETLVVGRMLSALLVMVVSQAILLAVGVVLFGARVLPTALLAVPAIALASIALAGVAFALAGLVLVLKEASTFMDMTNYLFGQASGIAFPIAVLPTGLQLVAVLLPTTYAMELLRHYGLGTRPVFDPWLAHAVLAGFALTLLPLGRWAFSRAERHVRVRGTLAQH